ncbi:hypothetical protein [Brucella anthropi]|uniref:hypothetical protein n=1 Tax=Brucella anthropi TaxID=529 RepID=UPI00124D2958|nr:hypothetical protein [Brucella anthropi]KAB2751803.1 hypothetical protein F9L05_01320 [Brucella anthropi]DAP56829.1 MAG TPA: head to tail adaptor [Caudoviricetes sp.]DAU40443.1 MAG TPA: head to tail adaptor [Caudoviricetes sp.]
MKVVELFRELSFGELSNLAISNDGSGDIIENKWPQLIQYTNSALTMLHKRFILRENDLIIEQVAHITNYHLTPKYAESSGSNASWPYIKDLPDEKFEDDLLKILSVHDIYGRTLPLNDTQDCNSLFTPQPDILQIPRPVAGQPLSIVYQAKHRKLDDRGDGPDNVLDQEIFIPHYLDNALRLYIAHYVFSHMNGQENIIKSQEYLAAYEADCLRIEQSDLVNQTFQTSQSKLEQRGFV